MSEGNQRKTLADPTLRKGLLKRARQVLITFLLVFGALFLTSGRLDWTMGWAFLGVLLAGSMVLLIVVLPTDPEVIAERAKVSGTKRWDLVVGALTFLLWLPTTLIVAGLDHRFGWSAPYSRSLQLIALVIGAIGYGLFTWSFIANRFFAATVRIQEERGHFVVDTGPYRYLRHPSYLGIAIFALASPTILGSTWAYIPAISAVVMLTIRTALEDRTLRDELEGYEEYAQRVRYRLIPGLW